YQRGDDDLAHGCTPSGDAEHAGADVGGGEFLGGIARRITHVADAEVLRLERKDAGGHQHGGVEFRGGEAVLRVGGYGAVRHRVAAVAAGEGDAPGNGARRDRTADERVHV